ncbi:endonuclease 4 isoform X3 [Physcomitrium patens]|uniref:endonuclease 4 isoform X3 n=1 Tax=Physcomitrium patens TaxID=3218 RepID=UPI000D153AA3|nr:endonuclease 4-like isoform X3 [Physcomitrium patens]|eukprot:XP_024387629.1 endonuclease 4-like isoform X3 [Physcomitrella patens]
MALTMMFAVVTVAVAFGVLFRVEQVVAWGADGHRVTCLIAEPLLYEPTKQAIAALLPKSANGNLADLCTWPDDVRWMDKYKWTRELHWVNTPNHVCKYDYNRDCHDHMGTPNVCISGAINNFTHILWNHTRNRNMKNGRDIFTCYRAFVFGEAEDVTEALLFLAHFMGDIHQPLHTGFRSDQGGNNISVYWYHRRSDLHHVWDTEIVSKALKENHNSDPEIMADSILNNATDNWASEVDAWGICHNRKLSCPDTYATESINLACKWAYSGAAPGTALGDEYYTSRLPTVELRLAQGGVRLAAILNSIFDPNAPQ